MNFAGGRLEGGLEGGLAHEGRSATTDEYYAQQYSQYYRFFDISRIASITGSSVKAV